MVEGAVPIVFWIIGLPAVIFAASLIVLFVQVWRKGLD